MEQPMRTENRTDVLSLLTLRQKGVRYLAPVLQKIDDLLAAVKPDLIRVNSVNLIITGDCNIHCVYCEYPTRYHGLREFTAKEWVNLISEMRASGISGFAILGGEPLLRPDWPDIVDACLPAEVWLVTNGTFVNEKIAANVAKRFQNVRVSLDASNAATYEAVRRNKRFDHVLKGIQLLRDRGVGIELSYVIVDRNVSDITRTAHLAASLGTSITFSIVGFENNNRTGAEDRELIERIDKVEVVKELRAAMSSGPHVSINHKVIDFLLDEKPKRCYAAAGALMVDGLGDVYPCCGPTPPIGNVKREPWSVIKARHDASWERYRQMQAEGCDRCDAAVGELGFLKTVIGRR